jgi:hypothetical protein
MTIMSSASGLQREDYDEIEATLMASGRGRAFLAEHARRSRSTEGARMLAAIERLEARLEAQQALAPVEAFTLADRLDELSWSLRERGLEDFVCDKIAALAAEFRDEVAGAQDRTKALAARDASSIAAERECAEAPASDTRFGALSWLDGLPLVDRFALFA